ncbi:MAG: DUF465 domain-containing protein [Rhodobacteraceae bacterium]|nr:DUF465 domain-containing protein [Paracoccaceae bacterium]
MSHTPNELAEQFPQAVEKMHDLKTSDAHFAKLHDDYHELNRDIHRAETDVEPTDDFHLEDMRKKRLALLDEISPYLR